MKIQFKVLFACLMIITSGVGANESTKTIEKKLSQLIPGKSPSSIKESAVKGVYEVAFGAQVFYMSKDGKYIFQGDLVDVESRKSLTAEAAQVGRKDIMKVITDENSITYAPKKTKHTVTVFTDIDCPYCAKMHNEMKEYNDAGIAIRYMLYPRAGVGSPSYKKAVSVWCAKDRLKALTAAKNQEEIEAKTCENPVKKHLEIGAEIGVSGTPAIVMDDGAMIPGYRPAKDLARLLNQTMGSK